MRAPITLPPGIVSDDTTFATPGRWEDANNMRFVRGMPQTVGGYSSAISSTVGGVCRNLLAWTDNSGKLNVAFGTHSGLYVMVGGELFDITPTGLAAGAIDGAPSPGYGTGPYGEGDYGEPSVNFEARTWSLATYGENLIASPRGGKIYRWQNNTAVVAAVIPNAPEQNNWVLVTPERQILALGTEEETSGTYNPLCIRGSNIEDPETWTTAPTNNAFEHILEGGGKIVTGRLFGSYVTVWTDSALHLGQFIGSLGQAYRFDRVEENCGLIGPNAVAILSQVAYWIGTDFQFRAYGLGGSPQILSCPIRNDFKDNVDTAQAAKIVAASITQFGEVWWFYPDTRDGNENSRHLIYSVSESGQVPVWSRGTFARTAFSDAGLAGYPLGVDVNGNVYYHETGRTANGGVLSWHIKSSDQYLGEGDRSFAIRGLWPDFEDQAGTISLTVYLRQYPQNEATEHGPYTLTEGQSKKDFRASGRVAALKFAGASSPSFARLGKPTFDAVVTGER